MAFSRAAKKAFSAAAKSANGQVSFGEPTAEMSRPPGYFRTDLMDTPLARQAAWQKHVQYQNSQIDVSRLDWVRFQSSNVWGAAYVPSGMGEEGVTYGRLFIRFHSGAIYRYESFPEDNWGWFKTAPSKGKFVYYSIRSHGSDSAYAYARIA